jgi:hypothetical protein
MRSVMALVASLQRAWSARIRLESLVREWGQCSVDIVRWALGNGVVTSYRPCTRRVPHLGELAVLGLFRV